ncbi:MAG: TusE/DsrC/DsvC family sulfur relay protein [Gammaproteobacteria bacterium]|nr:TusE/DsrC/DsvC family sulfur relay protein [Gammaproteobacteria bacterium]
MITISNIQPRTSKTSTTKFDDDGYLLNQHDWHKDLANQIANDEGITLLTDDHWQVIYYIRDYFNRLNSMPPPRRVCRQLGIEGHNIKSMFGSCLAAWRISGLPNPGEEAIAHMH